MQGAWEMGTNANTEIRAFILISAEVTTALAVRHGGRAFSAWGVGVRTVRDKSQIPSGVNSSCMLANKAILTLSRETFLCFSRTDPFQSSYTTLEGCSLLQPSSVKALQPDMERGPPAAAATGPGVVTVSQKVLPPAARFLVILASCKHPPSSRAHGMPAGRRRRLRCA